MTHIKITAGKYEYCPNGNYWSDVSGIFDDKLYLFCECNKCNGKLYELRPTDITSKTTKETFMRIRKEAKLQDIKSEINFTNMDKVKDFLTTDKERM